MAGPTLRQSTMIQVHDHISLTHVQSYTHTYTPMTHLTFRANGHILASTSLASIASKTIMAPSVCEECGKSFTLATNLARHKKVHVSGKFSCSRCSSKFHTERSLGEHEQKLHGKPLITNQTYVCDICGKCLNAKSSLKQHVEIHLDQCFNCDICSATFKTERS